MRAALTVTLSGLALAPAWAADVAISVQIPRINQAEYHRPYVAIWLEQERKHVADLAVWYDIKLRNNEGTKWLKDMRQWWRVSGRDLDMPVDGLSQVTRPPGEHRVAIDSKNPAFEKLPAGAYNLVVEAAREVGGRELVRVPFEWPPKKAERGEASGSRELGKVAIELNP